MLRAANGFVLTLLTLLTLLSLTSRQGGVPGRPATAQEG